MAPAGAGMIEGPQFHQARWNEPIVFELGSPGERAYLPPPVEAGIAVEQSMITVPGRMPWSTPFSPCSTASTCGVPVTHRISTSTAATSACGVDAVRTPAAFN